MTITHYALVFALGVACPARAAEQLATVLPLGGSAEPAVRRAIADAIRVAVEDIDGLRVQPAAATDAVLASARDLGMGCDLDSTVCTLRMGGLAGAAVVVVGRVDAEVATAASAAPIPNGAGLTLSLRAFDVATMRARGSGVATIQLELPASSRAAMRGAKQAVVRLLAPERERGFVRVQVTPAGATVVVDGIPRGSAPLASPVEVSPGSHEVWAGKFGFESAVLHVDVAFDDEILVDLQLVAEPQIEGKAPAPLAPPVAPVIAVAIEKPMRIAVYDVEAPGLPPHLARVVQNGLLAELRKLDHAVVIGMDEIRKMLDHEAERQLTGWSADTSCLSGIADALGADVVIVTSLTRVGDQSVFSARRLETRTATVTQDVVERLTEDDGREFLAVIGPSVAKLFPDLKLARDETRGVNEELALSLSPPPLDPWVFWITAGGAGALLVATAAAGAWNQVSLGALTASGAEAVTDGARRAQLESELRASGVTFWSGLAGTAVVGASAGVVALFVDWRGYRVPDDARLTAAEGLE